MALRPGNIEYTSWANRNAKPFGGFSSNYENYSAAIGQVFDEESSMSSLLHDASSDDRNAMIRRFVSGGLIPEDVMDSYKENVPYSGHRIDYNGIAKYANESLDLAHKFETDEEIIEERNKELSVLRKYREQVFDTSLTGGKVSSFFGMMTAGSLDPIAVASMPATFPLLGVRATSRAMYTLSMTSRGATFNMATAAPIEPFIHSWKEEIGADYTVTDSLFNIGATGLLGGGVTGFAANVGFKYRGKSLANKDFNSIVTELKKSGLDDEDAENLARVLDEANHAPDSKMETEDFLQKTETTQENMNAKPIVKEEPPSLDPEDIEQIEAAYNEVPEDLAMIKEDGTKSTFSEQEAELKVEFDSLQEKLGCLRNG